MRLLWSAPIQSDYVRKRRRVLNLKCNVGALGDIDAPEFYEKKSYTYLGAQGSGQKTT